MASTLRSKPSRRQDEPPAELVVRVLRGFSSVLIITGLLLVADAVLTVTWQEPVSAVIAAVHHGELEDGLDDLEAEPTSPLQRQALAQLRTNDRRLAYLARRLDRRTRGGKPLGRLRIPSIGHSSIVVQGTDTDDLKRGPGHYPDTPLPGARGTVAVAGHRTTYGAPFREVNQVKRGDEVTITLPYGKFTYEVERKQIVLPTATEVTKRVSYDRLVLSACHPLYSAAKRIIVFARLVKTEPRGAALAT